MMFFIVTVNLLNLQNNTTWVCKKFDFIFASSMLMRELILYISSIWKKDARRQFLLVSRNLSAVWTTRSNSALWSFSMDNLWLTNARSSITRRLVLSGASSKPSHVTSHWNWRPRKLNPYFFGWFLASFICLFDYWTFLAMKEKCCSFIFPQKVYQVMAP